MLLQRMKNNVASNCERESCDLTFSRGAVVVDFPKFGNGTDRHPDFKVVLTWQDIERIVATMAEKNHKGAARVQKALRLAEAVEAFGNSN